MLEFSVASSAEYVGAVLELRKQWFPDDHYPEIWYRGVDDSSYDLQPGAYWRKRCDELSLVLSFQAMAPLLLPRMPADDWEWYILMQHYRLPTRLLDWTENPLQGLHFALSTCVAGKRPCVWVLDPVALNYSMHGHEYVYVPTDSDLENDYSAWLPRSCGRGTDPVALSDRFESNEKPIAIFPVRSNPRIFAQRGVFTVHGTDETPLNHHEIRDRRGREGIARILVDPDCRLTMLDDLWTLGHTTATTYPEPDSVSADLKRMYRVE